MVLQTQEVPRGHWQRSCMQACTCSSSGTRSRQSSKAASVSSLSHSARWRATGGAAHGLLPSTPQGGGGVPSGGQRAQLWGEVRALLPQPPPPQWPATHVLRAGRGGRHLLGAIAHLLGLVDLLHVPKLDGTEAHAWGPQPFSGAGRGACPRPTHQGPARPSPSERNSE